MSRARDLSKLGNPNVIKADENSVGFGTQVAGNHANADSSLISAGIITATAYYGDGSNLEGVASAGLGTAVDDTKDSIGQNIYFTNQELSINENTTVNAPDTSSIAYTQYQQVTVESGSELIIADGDSFIPDVLGIGTALQASTAGAGNGLFGTVYVDNIENAAGRGGPNFPLGITVAGVSTLGGNVSIGGTLTYEDVTNVDSIGVVTARSGVDITGASAGVNGSSNLILKTGGSERSRIDSSGRLLIGSTDSMNVGSATGDGLIQISRTNARVSQSWNAFTADGGGVVISLGKSRSATPGNYDIVQNNDEIGAIRFAGADGTDLVTQAAKITSFVDGTPGANDMPGRLEFHTTADGAAGPTERLRITKNGAIGIAGANYGTSGQVLTSQGGSAAVQWADASSGAWEKLASGSATSGNHHLVTSTHLTATHFFYKIVFAVTLTDGEFGVNISSDGGTTWTTSGWGVSISGRESSTWGNSEAADFGALLAGNSRRYYAGEIKFANPGNTAKYPSFMNTFEFADEYGSTWYGAANSTAIYRTAGSYNAIRLQSSVNDPVSDLKWSLLGMSV